MLSAQIEELAQRIGAALAPQLVGQATTPSVTLERPKDAGHGDLACAVALQAARQLKRNPRELAQAIITALMADPQAQSLVERAEVAGPGFINLWIAPAAYQAVVRRILEAPDTFGRSAAGQGRPLLVEFVSANPTGPLHVGHGRQAALGDALASILAAQGWRVTREFYYNDGGAQILQLARSVKARLDGVAPGDAVWPADGYQGAYIAEIAEDFRAGKTASAGDRTATASGDESDLDAIREFAVAMLRLEQDLDLGAFGVHFDNFFLESSLYADDQVGTVVRELIESGKTYESDGALWLRTTDFGDDKDRVVRKSDGSYTYFVPDVAYHVTKWQRGFVRAINVQGGDHHGTVARVRAGLQALNVGIPEHYPDYLLHKMVRVVRGGEEVKISKRAGSYVTLRDLIDWAGRDAVRFFLVSRKPDTEFTFDIDLALSRSEENPVYYVQYAHARISAVLAQWAEREGADAKQLGAADLTPLGSAHESALMRRLSEYPDVLRQAALEMAPHQLAFHLRHCAAALHSYYNAERVLVDDRATRHARLALLLATRHVLADGLALIGVSAPQRM